VPLVASGDLSELAACLARHGSPFLEEGWTQEASLLRRAAQDGARVALTGDGGDELFNDPWAYMADLLRGLRWVKLAREIGPRSRYYQRTRLEALRHALSELAPEWSLRLWRRLRPRAMPPWIDPRFADRVGLAEQLRAVRSRLPFRSICAETGHHALTRGRMVLMHEQREWAAAQHGVEYRFPFYDRRLIEFLLAIPYERKSEGGQPKSLLRSVPGLLPQALAEQQEKADTAGLIESLLRRELGVPLEALFQSPPPRAAAYIVGGEVRKCCREFLEGADNRQKAVWVISCFFLWIQHAALGITVAAQGKEPSGEDRTHQASAH
jgi:asparagine synthase (glutamine-hydrolysing)